MLTEIGHLRGLRVEGEEEVQVGHSRQAETEQDWVERGQEAGLGLQSFAESQRHSLACIE